MNWSGEIAEAAVSLYRQARVKQLMEESDIAATLVFDLVNIRYAPQWKRFERLSGR